MTFIEGNPISRQEEKPLLTLRQMEILKLTAKGKQNKEIGQELGMKLQTIKSHFSSRIEYGGGYSGIFERLGVQSRTEAVMEAIRRGFLKLEEI